MLRLTAVTPRYSNMWILLLNPTRVSPRWAHNNHLTSMKDASLPLDPIIRLDIPLLDHSQLDTESHPRLCVSATLIVNFIHFHHGPTVERSIREEKYSVTTIKVLHLESVLELVLLIFDLSLNATDLQRYPTLCKLLCNRMENYQKIATSRQSGWCSWSFWAKTDDNLVQFCHHIHGVGLACSGVITRWVREGIRSNSPVRKPFLRD